MLLSDHRLVIIDAAGQISVYNRLISWRYFWESWHSVNYF